MAKFLVMTFAIVIAFLLYAKPIAFSIRQGLDLQGGTHVVLQAVDTPDAKVDDDAVNRVVKIIENRINSLGLTEPTIQRQGKDRIIVELPGVKDPDKAIDMLGRTALLEFKDISGMTVLTGKDLKNSKAHVAQNNQPVVGLEFNDDGAKKFAALTAQNIGKPISILLDGDVLTSPVVQEVITGGNAQISGSRTMEEPASCNFLFEAVAPFKVDVMEIRNVGPTLGQDSNEMSLTFAIEQ
jgi:preprotein translocase subunit SecD